MSDLVPEKLGVGTIQDLIDMTMDGADSVNFHDEARPSEDLNSPSLLNQYKGIVATNNLKIGEIYRYTDLYEHRRIE